MFKRIFSLKSKRDFRYLLRDGKTLMTPHMIIKYDITEEPAKKKLFGIIASSKFSKRAVIKNKAKRIIAELIRKNIVSFPEGRYVFIPKKSFLADDGKINTNVEKISPEIDTLLSKMDVS